MDILVLLTVILIDGSLSFLVANYAVKKGRDWGSYFVMSLVLSPLIGFLITAAGGETEELQRKRAAESKKCPACAEIIRAAAVVCRYCGTRFEAAAEQASAPAAESERIERPVAQRGVEKDSGMIPLMVGLVICAAVLVMIVSLTASMNSKTEDKASEGRAIADIRRIETALLVYRAKNASLQFPPNLASLGDGGENLIDDFELVGGVKDGYIFKYEPRGSLGTNGYTRYRLIATPAIDSGRGFYADESGVIRSSISGVAPSESDTPIQ